jgi:anti-anti-sigma regulatory factor
MQFSQGITNQISDENQGRVRWIDHYGDKYLLLDFSDLADIETFKAILEARRVLSIVSENSTNVILDMSNVDLSYNTHMTLKKVSKDYQRFISKSSIVGMNETTKSFYPLYKLFTQSKSVCHNTREEALEYLFGSRSMSA